MRDAAAAGFAHEPAATASNRITVNLSFEAFQAAPIRAERLDAEAHMAGTGAALLRPQWSFHDPSSA